MPLWWIEFSGPARLTAALMAKESLWSPLQVEPQGFQNTFGEDTPTDAGYVRHMTTSLQLPFIVPWHWSQFHQYFTLRLLPGVESLALDQYSRTVSLGGQTGWFSVRLLNHVAALELSLSDSLRDQSGPLAAQVTRMFDLNTDPAVLVRHFAADTFIGPLVTEQPALRLPSAFDPFEVAVRAFVGQQVSVKAAVTITRRLIERLGMPLPPTPASRSRSLSALFPTAWAIARGNLDAIGMPAKRVLTLQTFAAAVDNGALTLNINQGVDDLVERLCQLPGIGTWTAEYIALRGFAAADAFPAADLGLLKAPLWGPIGLTAKTLLKRAECWRPWRAYAAMHIWQDYARREHLRKALKAAKSSPTPSPDR